MSELITQYMSEASNAFDLTMLKVNAVTEAAKRQLAINYNEAELKVMTESGTDDDLSYLYEEANKSFAETIQKTIDKVIEALTEFFHKIQEKVIALIRKKETQDTIDKIEKKVKLFPLLGKKKVIIENTPAQIKVCNEHMSALAKFKAKVKSGQTVKEEDISAEHDKFADKYGKSVGVGAAVTTTVSEAIALLHKRSQTVDTDTSNVYKNSKQEINDLKKATSDNTTVINMIAREIADTSKKLMSSIVNGVSNLATAIKKAVVGSKGEPSDTAKPNVKKESTEDDTGGPTPEDQAAQLALDQAEAGKAVSEDGPEEDEPSMTDPMDALDAVDAWDKIMDDLELDDGVPAGAGAECDGDECGKECGTECGDECTEGTSDSFDALYHAIMGTSAPEPSDDASASKKPSSDATVDSILKDILAEVKGHVPTYTPAKPLAESSAYDKLLKEIQNLK